MGDMDSGGSRISPMAIHTGASGFVVGLMAFDAPEVDGIRDGP